MWLHLILGRSATANLTGRQGDAAATTAILALTAHHRPAQCRCRRWLRTTSCVAKKSKFFDKFLDPADRYKRPSDLEIKKKDLPPNQPTLGERVERDRYHLFHQRDEKHGYRTLSKYPDFHQTFIEQLKYDLRTQPKETVKQSFRSLKEEISKFGAEMRHGLKFHDRLSEICVLPGQSRKEWGFQSELDVYQWVLTKDSDWGEGYSSAEFYLNSAGTAAVLRGDLSTRVPADGRTQYAGYVNIASMPQRLAFAKQKVFYHWENYTHLAMNVRGDGRKYMLNMKLKRDYDLTWDDRFHYPLFTRGGPYWQYVKIPFSKFYLGSKGVLQDKQNPYPAFMTVGMSISLKDRISGPFQLEIKDISVLNDATDEDETFAYEKYKVPDFWAGY